MKQNDLKNIILNMTSDVTFYYGDNDIFIDPFVTNDGKTLLSYKDKDKYYDDLEILINDKVIDGKSLNDICEDLEVL